MVVIDTFKKMLQKDQKELKKIVTDYLDGNGYKTVVGDGFVYGKGDIPIMLVAHLDTVHKSKPSNIYYDEKQGVLWSPQGIGGDDRCGVYIITKLIEDFKPYILFTEDEEKGGLGAKKAIDALREPDLKFIIEIDRRGSDDCVFYDCGNEEFQKYIESFGFKKAFGTYTDIRELSDEWEIASVNLSSGYYSEHTTSETINVNDMTKTYERVKKILSDEKSEYYEYKKIVYPAKTSVKGYSKGYVYEDGWGYVGDDGRYHYWNDKEEDYDRIL